MTTAQVAEWKRALAELHATQRRHRGRRNRDPYAKALPVSVKLPPALPRPQSGRGR